MGGSIASTLIGNIGDLPISKAAKTVGTIHERNDLRGMKNYLSTLYFSVRENAANGRFLPGQKILTAAQLGALKPEAARGSISADDINSPEGNKSSIR